MNSSENQLIALRYAKSLLELDKTTELSNLVICKNLESIKEILQSSNELFEVLKNPVISINQKEEIIGEVFKADTDTLIMNFLKLLVKEGRFELILEIIRIYNNLLDKLNNIVKAEVTSAVTLEDEFKNQIENKLKEKLNKDVIVNYKTDKSIIAGLIYKIGDDVFDSSLKNKFEKIKKAIIK